MKEDTFENEHRIIYLSGNIDDKVSAYVIGRLLYLDVLDHIQPIMLYINSPGGYVNQGLAIIDVMNIVKCPVNTIALGLCASMATVILVNGKKRAATSNTTLLIHPVSSGSEGNIYDMNISIKQANILNKKTMDMLKKKTDLFKKYKCIERDLYLSPQEAKKLKIIDKII